MRSRLSRLLGVVPDAMVIVDAQGRILQANARSVSVFGFSESQLKGTPIQALFPDQPVPSPSGCSRRNQVGPCVELVASRADSGRFRAAVAVMPIETDNGAAAVIGIRDITEARETQFVLERSLEILSTVIQHSRSPDPGSCQANAIY